MLSFSLLLLSALLVDLVHLQVMIEILQLSTQRCNRARGVGLGATQDAKSRREIDLLTLTTKDTDKILDLVHLSLKFFGLCHDFLPFWAS